MDHFSKWYVASIYTVNKNFCLAHHYIFLDYNRTVT